MNGARSSSRTVLAGVPQGAVLSPVLFNCYLHDVPNVTEVTLAQFADDVAFLATSHRTSAIQRRLQAACRRYESYFRKWKVRVNGSKSEAILFTRKTAQRHQPTSPLRVGTDDVPWKSSLRYLGVVLDKRLTYKDHIRSVISRSELTTRSLYSIINRNSRLDLRNKLHIFKSVFRQGYCYGAPVFAKCANVHKRTLQIHQNKLLKMMMNKPWRYPTTLLHSRANVELVTNFLDRSLSQFVHGCTYNNNRDIVDLVSN
jgi:hypothetical protein